MATIKRKQRNLKVKSVNNWQKDYVIFPIKAGRHKQKIQKKNGKKTTSQHQNKITTRVYLYSHCLLIITRPSFKKHGLFLKIKFKFKF